MTLLGIQRNGWPGLCNTSFVQCFFIHVSWILAIKVRIYACIECEYFEFTIFMAAMAFKTPASKSLTPRSKWFIGVKRWNYQVVCSCKSMPSLLYSLYFYANTCYIKHENLLLVHLYMFVTFIFISISIHFLKLCILARWRRPPAAFLLNEAITRGANGTKTFRQTCPSYMQSFIKIGVPVFEKSGIKTMTLCNFDKDTCSR